MRIAAQALRELIRKNTLDEKHNKCAFDKTVADRKREAAPITLSSTTFALKHA